MRPAKSSEQVRLARAAQPRAAASSYFRQLSTLPSRTVGPLEATMITSAALALILAHGAATTVELGLQANQTEICAADYWSCGDSVVSDGARFVFSDHGYVSFQGMPYDSGRDVEIVWQVSDENANYNDDDEWNTFSFNVLNLLGFNLQRTDSGGDDCFPMEEDYGCDDGGSCTGWNECVDAPREYMWTLSAQSGNRRRAEGPTLHGL